MQQPPTPPTPLFFRAKLALGLVVLLLPALMLFQNCAQLKPAEVAVDSQASIEIRAAQDSVNMAQLFSDGRMKGWYSAAESVIDKTGATVTAVHSLDTGHGAKITLSAGATPPTYQATAAGQPAALLFSGAASLSSNDPSLLSDSYSIVAVLESGTAAQPQMAGKLFSFAAAAGTQELLMRATSSTSGQLVSSEHLSSAGNTNVWGSAINLNTTSNPVVLASSFGASWASVEIQVNGYEPSTSPTYIGNPSASTSSQRQVVIGDPGGATTLHLHEMMIFAGALTPGELNSVSRFLGTKWGVTNIGLVK